MKSQLKTILIVIAVLAIFQIVVGAVFLHFTVKTERTFTYVTAQITDVQTEKGEEENSYKITSIVVTYTNNNGETVIATLSDYPSTFEIGTTVQCRYTTNPYSLSTQTTDWFIPIFTVCLGVVYAIGGIVLFAFRKKFGLYALQDTENGNVDIVDDDWSLDDDNFQC